MYTSYEIINLLDIINCPSNRTLEITIGIFPTSSGVWKSSLRLRTPSCDLRNRWTKNFRETWRTVRGSCLRKHNTCLKPPATSYLRDLYIVIWDDFWFLSYSYCLVEMSNCAVGLSLRNWPGWWRWLSIYGSD